MYGAIVIVLFMVAIILGGLAVVWHDETSCVRLLAWAVVFLALGCWMSTQLTVVKDPLAAYTVHAAQEQSDSSPKQKESVMNSYTSGGEEE